MISVDPAAAKKRHEKAVTKRNVTHQSAEDGMGVFRAELAADKAQLAYSVIDQLAYQLKRSNCSESDPRGVGAIRADVFSDRIDQLASTGTVTIRTTLQRRAAGDRVAGDDASGDRVAGDYSSGDRVAGDYSSGDRAPGEQVIGDWDDFDQSVVDQSVVDQAVGDRVAPAPPAPTCPSKGLGDRGHAGGPGQTESDIAKCAPSSQGETDPSSDADAYADRTKNEVHPDTGLGTHHGRITHLNVTIAASTLAGLDERPGDLDGHGPITADLARAIASSAASISAIAIKSGCGSGLDLGRTIYRPRLAQRDHVTTRDQTCRFPGCRRSAKRCQIDHSDEFCPGQRDGGVTCPCNLQCLCAFHHGLKTGGLWDSVLHSDASVIWTSPTGRSYRTEPRQWPTGEVDDLIGCIDLNGAVENPNDSDVTAVNPQPNPDRSGAPDGQSPDSTTDPTRNGYIGGHNTGRDAIPSDAIPRDAIPTDPITNDCEHSASGDSSTPRKPIRDETMTAAPLPELPPF